MVCGSDELAELSQTLLTVGQAAGALLFTPLADKIGRKPVHVFSHIGLFVVSLLTTFVPSYPWFALMKATFGFFQEVLILSVVVDCI